MATDNSEVIRLGAKKQPPSSRCKVCNDKTKSVFNINFKATPICESCSATIFLQQAVWYTKQKYEVDFIKK